VRRVPRGLLLPGAGIDQAGGFAAIYLDGIPSEG